eukprot:m.57939 g.57939  ORF g.57939 m.57939 type:complete len:376 (-) comp7842_c0_seq3:745-1872(-)
MLPLEGLVELEPRIRVLIKEETQRCRDEKSKVWRLCEAIKQLAQTMGLLAKQITDVQEKFSFIMGESLSGETLSGMEWFSTLAQSAQYSKQGLETAVVSSLESLMASIQEGNIDMAANVDEAEATMCETLHNYCKLAETKVTEKTCFEENAKVYGARKEWHSALLSHCIGLNLFTIKHPTMVHASFGDFLQVLQQFTNHSLPKDKLSSILQDIQHDVDHVTKLANTEEKSLAVKAKHIQEACLQEYYLEIDPNNPFLDLEDDVLQVTSKQVHHEYKGSKRSRSSSQQPVEEEFNHCGWIMHKCKRSQRRLSKSDWTLLYCNTENNSFQAFDLNNRLLVSIPLKRCFCGADDVDNRRHVFSVKQWNKNRRHFSSKK